MIVHYPTYIPRLPFQGFREKVMHHLIQKPTENIFQNEANQANLGSQKIGGIQERSKLDM